MLDVFSELPVNLALVAALLLAAGVLVLVVLLIRRRRRGRFSARFQILWDRKLTPHCPHCRTPLSDWGVYDSVKFEKQGKAMSRAPVTFGAYRCVPCMKKIRLVDEDGFELTPEQARERLQPNRAQDEG